MYVANSEPIPQGGTGRRWSRRERARPDIRRTEVKLDGIWGGGATYPGKPS